MSVFLSIIYLPIVIYLSVRLPTIYLSITYLSIYLLSMCPSVPLSPYTPPVGSASPGALAATHVHSAEGPSQGPAVAGSGLPGTESTRGGQEFVLVWPHLGSAAFLAPGPRQPLDPNLLRPAIPTLRVLPRLCASCPSSAHEASPARKSHTPASPLILFTPKVKLEPQSSAQGPTDPYSVWTLPAKPAGWPRRCPAARVRPHTPGNAMLHTRIRTG